MLSRDTAYVSSIPEYAEERVTVRYPDGAKEQAEYYLAGERVGQRHFHPCGQPSVEYPLRNGVRHGVVYWWALPGEPLSAEPYENGVPHGTAYQWGRDGQLIGTYTLEHGTGIDLWWQDWEDGPVTLVEIHYMQGGFPHGFEWWLNDDQESVYEERHWDRGTLHGIERNWNLRGRLRRGYPRYWVHGKRVTKRDYLRAAAKDPSLPPFRPEDNDPRRTFPPEIVPHLWGRSGGANARPQ
ncbi:MAG: hypothetical protein HY320_08220 [Armatimonadetes bacterium]|nr:hypothetical protein [Armatimonadota bacterium]